MELQKILNAVDHTLLKQTATWEEIKKLCDEGIRFHTASVCIPASFVKQASEYVAGKLPICTVIGFPNGYTTTAAKCFEAEDAVRNGASEIDMVINLGWVKEGRYDDILNEINAVKQACNGKLLKVIIETCMLTEDEKIRMCKTVKASEADFIKTSTGFGGAGANLRDIELMVKYTKGKGVKAAGGIKTLEDAEELLMAGATRLGTSRVVSEVKAMVQRANHWDLSFFS